MFQKAIPVWGEYTQSADKWNRNLIFREVLPTLKGAVLSVAAADFYRLTVNGRFVGFGPARTAKGYARVDVYDLSGEEEREENEILIEVAGYFCKSLSTVHQDSFFCAEIAVDGCPLKYTGRDFSCFENLRRVRKVERYSMQRHFGEIYDLHHPLCSPEELKTVPAATEISFLPRRVPYAFFEVRDTVGYAARGTFEETADGRADSGEFGTGKKQNAYSYTPVDVAEYGIFPEGEIGDRPYRTVGGLEKKKTAGAGELPATLGAGEWLTVDLLQIECGFLRFRARAEEDTDVILAFSELCEGEGFSFRRINFQGVVEYKLPRGVWQGESFEPYSFRHVALFVKRGRVTLESVGCRSYERDRRAAIPRTFRDPALDELYRASLRTFAHNAVDLYTDCPSRERAGWLCDSFFTGRAEYFLYGDVPIEDAFLENYVLYRNDGSYPKGVLPMCYPSTPEENNKFIPQWDMWYVLEVCEYLKKRRPDLDREVFRPSVEGVLGFLAAYENEEELLERLPSWNFVEWSEANSWTWDVNYPTNFLYAALLLSVSEVFDRPELRDKAERVRQRTVECSFEGEVFVDHAVRNVNGTLQNQRHVSEACQYYAVLFGGVDLRAPRYAALRAHIVSNFENFGGAYQFCPRNAFIGLYLRLAVLMEMGDGGLLRENLTSFFLPMCRATGTLWEYKDGYGSLDHGFASFAALALPLADRE